MEWLDSVIRLPLRRLRSLASPLRPYKPYPVPDDKHYADGDGPWAFLHNLAELPHYGVIAAYIKCASSGARVLDVGCGEGLLVPHLDRTVHYVGIDVSVEAIKRAREASLVPSDSFLVTDGTKFFPDEAPDAIVFNESLYYFDDPSSAIRHHECVGPEWHICCFDVQSAYNCQGLEGA